MDELTIESGALRGNALGERLTRIGQLQDGEFDFDPSKLKAEAAVVAFLENHIEKADWDVAP